MENLLDRRLLILALGMFALGTDSFVFAGILPEIAQHFDVSVGTAAQMTTAYAISYAVLAPVLAALCAHIPRKRLLLVGLGLFVLANLATALSPTIGIALLTRVFAGLGAALFSPTASGAGTMLVPPERRGFALSIIVAGLTAATALGTPIGAVIGDLVDWRWTLGFVAALGALAFTGIWALMPEIPLPPAVSLRKRFAPLADPRVALILATTFLAQVGTFVVYTYFSVVFDRAIGGSAAALGGLLVLWGLAGTLSNLSTGRILDKVGANRVLVAMLTAVMISLVSMPWAGANPWTAAIAVTVWGACSWGVLVPQQYRLVELIPSMAPVLIGLNTSATYVGVSIAGLIGAAAIPSIGAHDLGFVGSALLVLALIVSHFATLRITASAKTQNNDSPAPASA